MAFPRQRINSRLFFLQLLSFFNPTSVLSPVYRGLFYTISLLAAFGLYEETKKFKQTKKKFFLNYKNCIKQKTVFFRTLLSPPLPPSLISTKKNSKLVQKKKKNRCCPDTPSSSNFLLYFHFPRGFGS